VKSIVMTPPQLGEGIYTLPEASRVLRLVHGRDAPSLRRVRSWVHDGLTFGSSVTSTDVEVISFVDLVSVETVHRLTDHLSVYRIKQLEAEIRRDFPDLERPFANRVFYTDGASVWMRYQSYEIEIHGRRRGHLMIEPALRAFAEEIHFDSDGAAERWTPNPHIEINPLVQFGAPVVRDTRIPVATIKATLRIAVPADVADWYGLPVDQVEGLARYLERS
jgi:uncharacterized protein (DUF433 family)